MKPEKCKVRDGKFVEPCQLLEESTESALPSGKRKGVFEWAMSKPDTGPTRTFFGVKSGEYVSNGIVFNYCPFYGEKIDAPIAGEDRE